MNPPEKKNKTALKYHLLFLFLLILFGAYGIYIIAHLPLQSWDESHNLLSAFEMQKSGDYIGITWRGNLDHWDIKPPLFTWIVALSYKIFGFSEFSSRLPSFLFGMGILITFYFFFISLTKNYLMGIFTTFGLALSIGFFGQHGMITGDYDIMVSFFVLISFISVYKIFFQGMNIYFIFLGIALGLGFMAKSVAGIIPIAFLFSAFFRDKNQKIKLDYGLVVFAIILFYVLVIPYFLIRESMYHERYFSLLLNIDVLRRLNSVVEIHSGSWYFYLQQLGIVLKEWSKVFYATFILFIFWIIRFKKQQIPHFNILIHSLVAILIYLILFSIAKTKITWYIHPVFPIMILFSGVGLITFINVKYHKMVYLFLLIIITYQGRNLVLYNNNLLSRDYEFMSKNIILPNKDLMKDKTIFSADTLQPSALTYTEIFTNGKHQLFDTYDQLNLHLISNTNFDMVLVTDTSKLLSKENLNLISAKAGMGLYERKR